MSEEANTHQPGGDHYKKAKIQHWDAIKHWMTDEQYTGYLLGSASKYLARFNDKDGYNGVKKSRHYLQKLLEFLDELEAENKRLAAEELKKALSHSPNIIHHPQSSVDYTYEGGKFGEDYYRCKMCKDHFTTPENADPRDYHFHPPLFVPAPEEPGKEYVDQDPK